MSDTSIPAPDDQHKYSIDSKAFNKVFCELYGGLFQARALFMTPNNPLTDTPTTSKRRPPRKSGLYAVLHAAQQHGITHPKDGFWTMLPKEFDAILALEHKAVIQVVMEILRQTMGTPDYDQDGHTIRREWAPLTLRHFVRAGILSMSQAEEGIKQALAKGYIVRRKRGKQRFEYAIRWKGTN